MGIVTRDLQHSSPQTNLWDIGCFDKSPHLILNFSQHQITVDINVAKGIEATDIALYSIVSILIFTFSTFFFSSNPQALLSWLGLCSRASLAVLKTKIDLSVVLGYETKSMNNSITFSPGHQEIMIMSQISTKQTKWNHSESSLQTQHRYSKDRLQQNPY